MSASTTAFGLTRVANLRDSEADLETLRAVQHAAEAGKHQEAAVLADAALSDGLEHPLIFNVLALGLEAQGRISDAVALLQRGVRLAPADAGLRNALGLCLLRLERPEEAGAQFEILIALNPALPFAHASHGNSLLSQGKITAAEAAFGRAIALDSQHGPALVGLAHIAARRGVYREARELAEKALTVLPEFPDAVMSLASADLADGQGARAETRIRELLTDARVVSLDFAYANGLLGDILDSQNRPQEAFAAYEACNRELHRVYAERYGAGPGALEYVRGMTRFFEQEPSEPWKGQAPARLGRQSAAGHVFLLGFPRSGTTLLEVILEGHPNVVSLEENESLIDSVREFMRRPGDLQRLQSLPAQALEPFRAAYWRRVAAAGADVTGKVFVDKYPLNTIKLPLIARLFPDAKIIFACRDPRDVVLSCFRHRFRMNAPMFELLTLNGAVRYYDAVMGLGIRLTSLLPLNTCLVRHEDLVTGFAREMKRICAFLNLDWAPSMGDFALRTQKRGVVTPSTAQLVRGLNTEGLGQWRRYREFLVPVLAELEPWVKRFYYDP